ncbi:MAG: hypothetical protein A2236_06525, partial [Bacteroidetes bacterium RIFOXYA2_FULL_33_7]
LFVMIVFTSCSEFQKLLKSTDYELKYNKAVEYYNEKDYFRAQSLFTELLNIYKGTNKAEEIYFYYAYCYYGEQDYIMAGYYFKNYVLTYPNGIHKEECSYMAAYCYYLNSPIPSLDQAYTEKAIEELQLFINKYPSSERIKLCNEHIDKLRYKLETKSFNNAKLYYELGNYKAAIASLKSSLFEFPDSDYREDLLFLVLKSSYLLAENSIDKKKEERYKSALTEYHALVDEYPETQYKKEAERIFEASKKRINS